MNGVGKKTVDATGGTTLLQPPTGVVGCRKRTSMKTPVQPQLSHCERPFQWTGVAYEKNVFGQYRCTYCSATYDKSQAIQQHCRQHFPPEYQCTDCGDCFYLKGSWTNHFLRECDLCGKTLKGNLASHRVKCKAGKTRLPRQGVGGGDNVIYTKQQEDVEMLRGLDYPSPPPHVSDRVVPPLRDVQCMARVWNSGRGGQCTRSRAPRDHFCNTHGRKINQSQFNWDLYGRVDEEAPVIFKRVI
jgi:hypothetical protein